MNFLHTINLFLSYLLRQEKQKYWIKISLCLCNYASEITQLRTYAITHLRNYALTQLRNYAITQLRNYAITQL
jgi:hypothetical protein